MSSHKGCWSNKRLRQFPNLLGRASAPYVCNLFGNNVGAVALIETVLIKAALIRIFYVIVDLRLTDYYSESNFIF